jgi:hypothetical protein
LQAHIRKKRGIFSLFAKFLGRLGGRAATINRSIIRTVRTTMQRNGYFRGARGGYYRFGNQGSGTVSRVSSWGQRTARSSAVTRRASVWASVKQGLRTTGKLALVGAGYIALDRLVAGLTPEDPNGLQLIEKEQLFNDTLELKEMLVNLGEGLGNRTDEGMAEMERGLIHTADAVYEQSEEDMRIMKEEMGRMFGKILEQIKKVAPYIRSELDRIRQEEDEREEKENGNTGFSSRNARAEGENIAVPNQIGIRSGVAVQPPLINQSQPPPIAHDEKNLLDSLFASDQFYFFIMIFLGTIASSIFCCICCCGMSLVVKTCSSLFRKNRHHSYNTNNV